MVGGFGLAPLKREGAVWNDGKDNWWVIDHVAVAPPVGDPLPLTPDTVFNAYGTRGDVCGIWFW